MKANLFVLAVCLAVCCGCARSYVMTLTNGARITTASKPKLQQGSYVFKDAQGRDSYVPAGRVREITPASMAKDEKARFQPSGK